MPKTLLTAVQVAEYLNVAEATVRKWTYIKFIPHIKLGRTVRYDQDEIEKWIASKSEKGRKKQRPEFNL